VGLLGPNGAGKTTAIKLMMGFAVPDAGEIRFHGKIQKFAEPRPNTGYLPESFKPNPHLTVKEYILFHCGLSGISKSRAKQETDTLLGHVGMDIFAHRKISDLSKGMGQRVGLAQAFVGDPDLLILDEPTSGLDPNQIAEIRDIIRSIGKEKTIIFSTHILPEAEATCDRIVIINKGRVVADDTTAHLKDNVKQDSILKLSLKGAPEADAGALLTGLNLNLDVKSVEPVEKGLVSFEITPSADRSDDRDFRSDIYLKIKETDWIITQFTKESQALEKIFRELTREDA
ncbi:MAG: ATP-binding cassette domain-containing protein, partial [Desulfobacula sp.]|nr:ATP-binding cassette domain-containing protein [Desulfobacula sp.]